MSDLQKVLKRAKNLRDLQRGAGTPAEAKAAARALHGLLQRYRLELVDLDEDSDYETSEPVFEGVRIAAWRYELCRVLAREYGVFVWRERARVTTDKGDSRLGFRLRGYGRRDDVEMFRRMYGWLSEDVVSLAKGQSSKRSRASWRLGFVQGLALQLELARQKARQDATETSLTVVDGRYDQARAHYEKHRGRLSKATRSRPKVDDVSYVRGVASGLKHTLGAKLPKEKT